MTDSHRDAVKEANFRRRFCCNKCAQPWSASKVLGKDLPPSAQDAAFADQLYDYCAGCGNLRMRRK
jgi:hypothetical protein